MHSNVGGAAERHRSPSSLEAVSLARSAEDSLDFVSRKTATLAWYGLAVLLMTTLFALVVRQMLSLIAPALQSSLGFNDLQIGMLQGLGMAVFACIASYPMGWLADRYGRRLILAIGVGIWSLATAFSAFQNSFGGLFVGTIGIAIGEAGLAPIVYAMIPDLFPERRRQTANLIFYAGFMFGAGIGMALGGALLASLAASPDALPPWLAGVASWRLALAGIALLGPLFVLLIVTMPLANPKASRLPSVATDTDNGVQGVAQYAHTHWRTLVCVFGAIFAMAIAMTSGLVWFPLALPRAFGIDPTTVGVDLGTAVTAATLIGVFLPGLVLKLGQRADGLAPIRVAALFFWLTPLPAAFLPFVSSPTQAYVVAALQGAMGIAGSALMPGILQELAPSHLRSRVLALLGIVNALALAASPLAIGLLSDLSTGPRGMLNAITAVSMPSLIAAAVLLSLARRPYAATVQAIGRRHSGEAA